LQFARSINTAKNKIAEPWKSYLDQLAADPLFQQIELQHVRKERLNPAIKEAKSLNLQSQRGLAMMFDIVTQHGPGWRMGKRKYRDVQLQQLLWGAKTENERLEIIANFTADMSLPEYKEKVRERRMSIAKGQGKVHGRSYDLTRDFGLTEKPF
jgi:hypothetical protein